MWLNTVLSLLHPASPVIKTSDDSLGASQDLESQEDTRCLSVSSRAGDLQHVLGPYSNTSSWDQAIPGYTSCDMSNAILDVAFDLDGSGDVSCASSCVTVSPAPPPHNNNKQRHHRHRAPSACYSRASLAEFFDPPADDGRTGDAHVEVQSLGSWTVPNKRTAPSQPNSPYPGAPQAFNGWRATGKHSLHAPQSPPLLPADDVLPADAVALVFGRREVSPAVTPAVYRTVSEPSVAATRPWLPPPPLSPPVQQSAHAPQASVAHRNAVHPAPQFLHRMQSSSAAALPSSIARQAPPTATLRRFSEQPPTPFDLPIADSPVSHGRSLSMLVSPPRPLQLQQATLQPTQPSTLAVAWNQVAPVHAPRPSPAVAPSQLEQAEVEEWHSGLPSACVLEWPGRPTFRAQDIRFEELQLLRQVGQGGFGQVHMAAWRGLSVAVKVASLEAQHEAQLVADFHREVHTMATIPAHPNVLRLIGSCTKMPHLALVTEFCSRGSLFDKLHSMKQPLDLVQTLRVCLDVARGMAHLHACHVLHRDLKSANLLLDDSGDFGRVKICDFGLSRLVRDWSPLTGGLGTFQWMAPEVLTYQRYSDKADVYSFGIVMHELLTRDVPYAGRTAVQAAVGVVNSGLRPPVPLGAHPGFTALMTQCWAAVPDQRPSFGQIVLSLEALMIEAGCLKHG